MFFVHRETFQSCTVFELVDYYDALAMFEAFSVDADSADVYVQDKHGRRIVATHSIHPGDGPFAVLPAGSYQWSDSLQKFVSFARETRSSTELLAHHVSL